MSWYSFCLLVVFVSFLHFWMDMAFFFGTWERDERVNWESKNKCNCGFFGDFPVILLLPWHSFFEASFKVQNQG